MPAPDELLQPSPASAPVPEGLAREFEAIELDEVDKENRGWVKKYLAGSRERLAEEQAADQPDLVMVQYLKREIATYEELLERTGGQK